jgi:uncharacterized protein (TIGR02466 family)
MVDIVNKNRLFLFPTIVSKGRVNDDSFIERLKASVIALKTNGEGHFSKQVERFESEDNLHERSEFKELCDLILEQSGQLLDEQSLIRESHYITGMWATISNRNFFQTIHTHPNNYLSGLIYINAPENCGHLVFRDPRPVTSVMAYEYFEFNYHSSGRYTVKPEKGGILFWPHWLEHMVEPHNENYTGEEDRMMIAFNIMIKTDIKLKTAKLKI